MAKKKKNPENNKCWQECGEVGPLFIADGIVKWCNCCEKQSDSSSNFSMELPYDPAIPLLDVYPKVQKAGRQKCVHPSSLERGHTGQKVEATQVSISR